MMILTYKRTMENCFNQLSKEKLAMYNLAPCHINVVGEPQYRHPLEFVRHTQSLAPTNNESDSM